MERFGRLKFVYLADVANFLTDIINFVIGLSINSKKFVGVAVFEVLKLFFQFLSYFLGFLSVFFFTIFNDLFDCLIIEFILNFKNFFISYIPKPIIVNLVEFVFP